MTNTEVMKFIMDEPARELRKAIIGEIPYDTENGLLKMGERMIYNWITGTETEESVHFIEALYQQLKEVFPYQGTIYRGLRIDAETTLYPTAISSFTSEKRIAEKFAGTGEFVDSFEEDNKYPLILEIEVEEAFALDDLLRQMLEFTEDDDLYLAMEDFIEEHEKICPMPKEVITTYIGA